MTWCSIPSGFRSMNAPTRCYRWSTTRNFRKSTQSVQMLANLALETHVAPRRCAPIRAPRKCIFRLARTRGVVTIAGIVDRGMEPVHASEVTAAVPRVKRNKKRTQKSPPPSRVKLDQLTRRACTQKKGALAAPFFFVPRAGHSSTACLQLRVSAARAWGMQLVQRVDIGPWPMPPQYRYPHPGH